VGQGGHSKSRGLKFLFLFFYLLKLGCYLVAVIILHINKT